MSISSKESCLRPVGDVTPSDVDRGNVGIVGAGLMGRNIALANLQAGYSVLISEASKEVLVESLSYLEHHSEPRLRVGGPNQRVDAGWFAKTVAVDDVSELAEADMVIEAVVENIGVKRRLLKQLESSIPSDTFLASNTSSLSVSKMAKSLKHPGRFCGLHFFHPVQDRPLVEVVRGEQTDPETIERAVEYVQHLGKQPLVVDDCPGFVVNRFLSLYLNEALALLDEGISFETIEQAAIEFGMGIGPLAAIDSIGVDVAVRVGWMLQKAYPQHGDAPLLVVDLYSEGKWGEKTGEGIFEYQDGQRLQKLSQATEDFLNKSDCPQSTLSIEDVTLRLFLPLLVEATCILDEGMVDEAHQIDNALVCGLGFPCGIFQWADSLGHDTIQSELKRWRRLGARFQPNLLLSHRLATGQPFYESNISKAA